jgi:hypothetical protein
MSSVTKVLFSNVYEYVIKQYASFEIVKMKVKHWAECSEFILYNVGPTYLFELHDIVL